MLSIDNKQRLVLLVTGLFLVLLCGGLSYAFFSSVSNNESSSTILAKGGKMTIKYANGSGTIKMENIYPREEAWVNKVFTVTGNNTTDLEMNYRLYLVVSRSTFNFGDLTYSISGTSTNSTDTLISKANQPISKAGQILMGAGVFKSKTSTHSYNLRIFYKETGENQNNGQEAKFSAYVKIDSGSTLAYDALTEVNTNTNSPALNGPISREEVEKITFNNTNTVPSNAIDSWDVSDKQNGSVMAYTLDEDNDGLYELYIGQNEGVVANPNSQYLFAYFSKLETINLNNLDTSKVTNMSYMFFYSAAKTLDLSSFDTSNVTTMSDMFENSAATEIKGLAKFDTSKVTSMSFMFTYSAATSLDLSSFDTSNVTYMAGMFSNSAATEIKGLDKFETSNVTTMSQMFYKSAATSLNLSNFNTSKVTSLSQMFSDTKVTTLNLSSFDTSKVTSMYRMFWASAATSLDLSSFDTSNVTNMEAMFATSKATSLDLSNFDTSNVTNMSSMFYSSAATEIKGLDKFDTSKVTTMQYMFASSKTTSLDLSNFDTGNVTNMSNMFNQSAVISLDLSNFNTSKVTNMSWMFFLSKATTLDLSSFDTSNVTNMYGMFMKAMTITGYARTQADADKFNASSEKPSGLTFVVKS